MNEIDKKLLQKEKEIEKKIQIEKDKKELFELAIQILIKEMPKYKTSDNEYLYYEKSMPACVYQNLKSASSKCALRPVYIRIENSLNINHRKAKVLIDAFWFSAVYNNLEIIRPYVNQKLWVNVLREIEKKIYKNAI